MCRFNNVVKRTVGYIKMEAITQSKEAEIDASSSFNEKEELVYEDKNGNVIAKGKDILLYGEINFDSKDDIELIKRKNIINEDGSCIYSNIDQNGNIHTINGKLMWYPTFDPIEWFKYCHLLIGKPERIIIYKENTGVYARRNI